MRVLLDECVDGVLAAPTNRLADLRSLLPRLLPALEAAASGHLVIVT